MTRRDILKFAAGATAGLLVTPAPWKALDDTAIWTQNWPWIPRPASGEVTSRMSTCTLCPAGCGIRARCINGVPVSLSGIPGHHYGNGSLCAVGLAAHHLAFHPARVRQPLRRIHDRGVTNSTPVSADEAFGILAGAITAARGTDGIALLDQRPGRSVSALYKEWLASVPNGLYLVPPSIEDGTLRAAGEMAGATFGVDLEHCRTILSFGTPLLDGWGTPGRMMRIASARFGSGEPFIIQAETRQSHTALAANRWLPLKPGTELALALGICHVLLRDLSVPDPGTAHQPFTAIASGCTPSMSAEVTGISADRIEETARYLAGHRPAIVVGGGDPAAGPLGREEQRAIVMLNFLLGSIGAPGGLVARDLSSEKQPQRLEQQLLEVPDHAIGVLILDGAECGCAIPWEAIEPKLKDGSSLVVSLSPFLAGLARRADLIIPSPVPLERWEDLPAPFDGPAGSLALSAPLFTPPEGSVDPVLLVRRLSGETGPQDRTALNLLTERVGSLHARRKGTVCAPSRCTPVSEVESAGRLFEMLAAGGVWVDEGRSEGKSHAPLLRPLTSDEVDRMRPLAGGRVPAAKGSVQVAVLPFGTKAASITGQVSPILSKVFQESGLRPSENQGFINPATCNELGLSDGGAATLSSTSGSLCVVVRCDSSVMPGVIHVAVGPDPAALNEPARSGSGIFALCGASEGMWRIARATIGKS